MLRVLVSLCLVVCGFGQQLTLPEGTKVERDIQYSRFPETLLDIYTPTGAAGKRPAVIVIHGGGWVAGDRAAQVPLHVTRYLAKGFVVANVEYRLAKAAPAPAAVEDALAAGQWFLENAKRYGVDPRRVVVTGGSAGGHLALMVGMTPKSARLGKPVKVAAVVNFYGITDVDDQLHAPNLRDYAVTWLPEQAERTALAARVSPLTYVRRDLPPILTIHGDADQTVPYEHGVRLTKALTEAGAKTEMIPVPGGRHGFPPAKMEELYVRIFAWLAENGIS